MADVRKFSTPMMQQYMQIRERYPDCLVLFRLGDFYELFLDDAHVGAKVLNITLTRRPRGKDGDIPMAGVPYHAADRYIAKLVKAGYKVAICEQVTASDNKGIVERDVVRIVTPGTIFDQTALEQKDNNFLTILDIRPKVICIARADVSTGSLAAAHIPIKESVEYTLSQELAKYPSNEILLHENVYNNPDILALLKGTNVTCIHDWDSMTHSSHSYVCEHFDVSTLKGFGLDDASPVIDAVAVLLRYVEHTQRGRVHHFSSITLLDTKNCVALDSATLSNLEVFKSLHEGKREGTVISILDDTKTPMGGRMLREWLREPLRDIDHIRLRHGIVAYFLHSKKLRDVVRDLLQDMYDLERVVSRLSVGIGHAGNLIQLRDTIESALKIHTYISEHTNQSSQSHTDFSEISLDSELVVKLTKVKDLIEKTIKDDPKIDVRGGGIIKKGVDPDLDELKTIKTNGKKWLEAYEEDEKKKTGITTLKVRYNKVFGFYIEVSKSFAEKAPERYERKQTLVNAERFTTNELKSYEEKIVTADEKMCAFEYEIFCECVEDVLKDLDAIHTLGVYIAKVDVLTTFANIADKKKYVQPTMAQSGTLHITSGRHPVVEQLIEAGTFVPNTTKLDGLHVITGPNMAGKSVYIRQTALVVLFAHIGSFVPAQEAVVPIVDRIFVRSGASDMITSGLSTFMVEMVETAHILNNASPKSLIILDEIGRGTSTYDGLSIAWAVSEYIVQHWKKSPKTLFATHYHELQELEDVFPETVKNYHMAVEEHKGKPVFLHNIVNGAASHSYGIAVAENAGVPHTVVQSAKKKLYELEEHARKQRENESGEQIHEKDIEEIVQDLKSKNIESLTPVDALLYLEELKKKL